MLPEGRCKWKAQYWNRLTPLAARWVYPPRCWLGYLYLRVKQLGAEVEKLRTEREADRRDADSKLSEIYAKLNSLASDVSFIRGKLEN